MLKHLLIAVFLAIGVSFFSVDASAQHREIVKKDMVLKGKTLQVGGDTYAPAEYASIEVGTDSGTLSNIQFHFTEKDLIASPQKGSLIYQGSDSSFYYYTGNIWVRMATGSP